MNPHTLSAYAQRALESARAEAVRLGHDSIGAEHIVLGLLRGEGPAAALFARLGLDLGAVQQRLESSGRRRQPRGTNEELAYTSHAKRLIEVASKAARDSGTGLSAEHLLLAALQEPRGTVAKILGESGVSAERAQSELQKAARGDRPAPDRAPRPGGPLSSAGLLAAVATPRRSGEHCPRASDSRVGARHLRRRLLGRPSPGQLHGRGD